MRYVYSIVLIALVLSFSACRGNTYKTDLKKIQENHMDLPDLKKVYYNGVGFKLSSLFKTDFNNYYVIQDNAMTKTIYGIQVNFSIEHFSESEAEDIQFSFEEEIDKLNAVHDHYVIKRASTLSDPIVTIKKELPKDVKYKGYIQVIHSNRDFDYDYESNISYFTASMKINNEYYIIQMIGKKGNMGYLYDDFLDILRSFS